MSSLSDTTLVLAARGVVAKDSGGTSDVYCTVYLDKEKVLKTEVLKKTVDPVFEHEKGKLLCVLLYYLPFPPSFTLLSLLSPGI